MCVWVSFKQDTFDEFKYIGNTLEDDELEELELELDAGVQIVSRVVVHGEAMISIEPHVLHAVQAPAVSPAEKKLSGQPPQIVLLVELHGDVTPDPAGHVEHSEHSVAPVVSE